jgi:uncharacterized SAM-binding protein YcdF (DUF218 family)
MTASAWLTPVLVPPINLAVLAALGMLAWRWRGGRWLAAVGLAGLLLLAMPAVAAALLYGLDLDGPQLAPATPPAAIVALGGDLLRDDAALLHAVPGALTLDRLREAAALARRTGLPLLVSGGIVLQDAAPVAEVMAASLRGDFLLPPRWVEPLSATTWENARNSAAILDAAGIRSVFVVTSAWHMRRALIAFARTDLAVTPAPVRRDEAVRWTASALIPRAQSWVTSYDALHEWIGCLWYGLRAWRARG